MENTQNGITWVYREEGSAVEVDLSVGSTLVQVENCRTQGAAEISVKSFLANHRAVGKRLLKLLVGPKTYRVKITDVDTREELFRTPESFTESTAWEHATDWIEDNPEAAPGDLLPEAHEKPAANDPAPPSGPVSCPACGREVKLRQGVLARHKANDKPLLAPNEKGYCAGGGWSLGDVAKRIEAEGDRAATPEDVAAAAKEAEEAIRNGPGFAPAVADDAPPSTITAGEALSIPENLPELMAIGQERKDRKKALQKANKEFNEAKKAQKDAQGAFDDVEARFFAAWENGQRQVHLPLGEASGPSPAKAGDITDQTWSFNGRSWTIKLKKLGDDQYLAMIPELTGDTEGHGQTVEAAVEVSKGKASILLADTDPGEKPEKKRSKKSGPKKASKRRGSTRRAPRGIATVTEGRVDA